MAEQARESILSLTNSLLEGMNGDAVNMSFADDETYSITHDDSVFADINLSNDSTMNSSEMDVSETALEITNSVSDRVNTLDEDGLEKEKLNDVLKNAYSTCMRRFERAIGHKMINSDIIKLLPVSNKMKEQF